MSHGQEGRLNIVHLTAHVGGGIGKALSSLIAGDQGSTHHVVCLEQPEKPQSVTQLQQLGAEVTVCPEPAMLAHILRQADIVQLEWWNHPATLQCLAGLDHLPLRLLSWCHVSGLFNPVLPQQLLSLCDKVVLTSPCSLQAASIASLQAVRPAQLAVISSGSGFAEQPLPARRADEPLQLGYLGSLNFSKLHPRYVSYFSQVALPLTIRMAGDVLNQHSLQQQAVAIGKPDLLQFEGFTAQPARFLASINVLPYLLNPSHYGTAENALLEAMAMGVVPIVLANPAEQAVVRHGETGFVINSAKEMAHTLQQLQQAPDWRLAIGQAASVQVREQFTSQAMAAAFARCYQAVLQQDKQARPFSQAIGSSPEQWFLSCQPHPQHFLQQQWPQLLAGDGRYALLEKTKGSVFHFHDHFPHNPALADWSRALACCNDN